MSLSFIASKLGIFERGLPTFQSPSTKTELPTLSGSNKNAHTEPKPKSISECSRFGGALKDCRDRSGAREPWKAILSARTFTAQQAYSYGLVNKVVPAEDVLDEAVELASCISQKPAEAVHYCLFSLRAGLNASLTDGLAVEQLAAEALFRTDVPKDGITAFMHRSRPDN